MPGPAPKPTALKRLAGNPGHRPLNDNEPNFPGFPECPDWLADEAKLVWKRVTDAMPANMLREADQGAFAAYCQSYARWRSAEALVEAEGQVVREPVLGKD